MANIYQQDAKTTLLLLFLISDVKFPNFNHFDSWTFLHATFFLWTPNTVPTLSHSKYRFVKY